MRKLLISLTIILFFCNAYALKCASIYKDTKHHFYEVTIKTNSLICNYAACAMYACDYKFYQLFGSFKSKGEGWHTDHTNNEKFCRQNSDECLFEIA